MEALVPWEKEASGQGGTEVTYRVGGAWEEGPPGGAQEKDLLAEIDYTLQNSPRLPRLRAGTRRAHIEAAADLEKF